MSVLIAEASASGEWHDGWQLVVSAVGVASVLVIGIVGWLLRVLFTRLKKANSEANASLGERCDKIEDSIADLRESFLVQVSEDRRLHEAQFQNNKAISESEQALDQPE